MTELEIAQQELDRLDTWYNSSPGWIDAGINPTGADVRLNNAYQRLNMAYNSAEAVKDRDFQKMMSDTQFSRAASDLQSIGFSPLALFSSANSAGAAGGSSQASYSGSAPTSKRNPVFKAFADVLKVMGTLAVSSSKVASASIAAASRLNASHETNQTRRDLAKSTTIKYDGRGKKVGIIEKR